MRNHNKIYHHRISPGNFPHPSPTTLINMSVLAGCFSCFGHTSGLQEDVLSLLEQYSLTRCVVRARITGYRLGESPYGFVDEVGLVNTNKILY